MFTVNKNPTVSDLKKFGWAMLLGFGAIGVLCWTIPWLRSILAGQADSSLLSWTASGRQVAALCFGALAVVFCVMGNLAPGIAKPVYVTWMSVVVPVGVVVSTIMLSALYFLLLPVFSLFVRRGDPLRKKISGVDSYWEDYRHYEPTMERMERQF